MIIALQKAKFSCNQWWNPIPKRPKRRNPYLFCHSACAKGNIKAENFRWKPSLFKGDRIVLLLRLYQSMNWNKNGRSYREGAFSVARIVPSHTRVQPNKVDRCPKVKKGFSWKGKTDYGKAERREFQSSRTWALTYIFWKVKVFVLKGNKRILIEKKVERK